MCVTPDYMRISHTDFASKFYVLSLALYSVSSRCSFRRVVSAHLALLLLVSFAVYAYRDIWPLMTYTLLPLDRAEGVILWAKVWILGFASILIPLVMPRQYIPYDARVRPGRCAHYT